MNANSSEKAIHVRAAAELMQRAELLFVEAQALLAQANLEFARATGSVDERLVSAVTGFHNLFTDDLRYARNRVDSEPTSDRDSAPEAA